MISRKRKEGKEISYTYMSVCECVCVWMRIYIENNNNFITDTHKYLLICLQKCRHGKNNKNCIFSPLVLWFQWCCLSLDSGFKFP